MNLAINELRKSIEVCETNIYVNEKIGSPDSLEQAKLERKIVKECEMAIHLLNTYPHVNH